MAADQPPIPNSPPEQHLGLRKEVVAAFDSVTGVIKAAVAPLPTQTGDGSAIQATKASGLLQDISHMHPSEIITLAELAKDAATSDPVDDKTFLMERLIKLASELPLKSKNGSILNDKFIQQLYDDLQHPPVSFLGDTHKFRAADGSFNVRPRRVQHLSMSITLKPPSPEVLISLASVLTFVCHDFAFVLI